ncbi:MAG: spore germination protein [Brockia lithotrophica]|nr:spore germination protein [Brockia lithotrophica]
MFRPWSIFRRRQEKRRSLEEAAAKRTGVPGTKCPKCPVSPKLEVNVAKVREHFHSPQNLDLKVRHIAYGRRKAAIVYLEGTIEESTIDEAVIRPLNERATAVTGKKAYTEITTILDSLHLDYVEEMENALQHLLDGHIVFFIDGIRRAFAIDFSFFPTRSVQEPKIEHVLKGPQEAFVEDLHQNLAILRRYLRSPNLVHESFRIGAETRTEVALLYLKGTASGELVDRFRRRLGELAQANFQRVVFIEELLDPYPKSLLPSFLVTERPDRAAFHLLEGHVVLMQENFPFVLIAPAPQWNLLHTPDEHYHRWAYGNFLRGLRTSAFFLNLLAPALYVAAVNFHPETIPLDLLVSIAGSREYVPYPTVVEVLLMEFSFELIREASTRIPTQIGPTIGIVGALILGQAAVQAGLISPILVIVVAITALASFAIPDQNLGFFLRIMRFFFIFAAALFGFLGIATLFAVLLAYMVSHEPFGVGHMAPVAPYLPSSKDTFFRRTFWEETHNPETAMPEAKLRLQLPFRRVPARDPAHESTRKPRS